MLKKKFNRYLEQRALKEEREKKDRAFVNTAASYIKERMDTTRQGTQSLTLKKNNPSGFFGYIAEYWSNLRAGFNKLLQFFGFCKPNTVVEKQVITSKSRQKASAKTQKTFIRNYQKKIKGKSYPISSTLRAKRNKAMKNSLKASINR